MPKDYSNLLVHKPWGYEYLFYENKYVAIWCLHIMEGQATSLHCHPNKKTGLIMLAGEATLSFLNDTVEMKPLSRHILRKGLFHSTEATKGEVIMLEIETPPKKEDIVRFEDKYGRKGKPIEGKDKMSPLPNGYAKLFFGGTMINGYYLVVDDLPRLDAKVIAILEGGLVSDNGDFIVSPGDVGSPSSLLKLQNSFDTYENTKILSICAPRP